MYCVVIFAVILNGAFCLPTSNYSFTLNIIHHNDFHARFDEFNINYTVCNSSLSPCIGGFARLYTLFKQLWKENPQSLVLNAGDTFQGTAWYNVLKWNVTQHFINLIPHDAHALGNHEFDSGIDGLVPYLMSLDAPVLAANVDASREPSMMNLYKKSIVVRKHGRRIGLIGVTTATSQSNFRVRDLIFLNASDAVRKEARVLRKQGVNIIVVISHCGFSEDKDIARQAGEYVDIIVGGHSHTLLYTGVPPSHEMPVDNYPTVITHVSGNRVLIVQAYCFSKYLGRLAVNFDTSGNILSWNGKPLYLDSEVVKDPMILREMQPYRVKVESVSQKVIGYTNVELDDISCHRGECSLGDFVCNALIDAIPQDDINSTVLCLINTRGIRNTIHPGAITYGDLIETMPFNNSVNTFKLKGEYLRLTLEHSVSQSWTHHPFMGPFTVQVSGIRVIFNITAPVGSRVNSVEVWSSDCIPPQFTALDDEKIYNFVSLEFVTMGGDGYTDISKNLQHLQRVGTDVDILEKYIWKSSPVKQKTDGRIIIQS